MASQRRIAGGVDQGDGVAGGLGGALSAAQNAPEERVGHIGDEEGHGARSAEPERLRGDVGAIAELARAPAHPLLGGLRDAPWPLPENTSDTVDCETPACSATSMLVTRWGAGRSMGRNGTTPIERRVDGRVHHT